MPGDNDDTRRRGNNGGPPSTPLKRDTIDALVKRSNLPWGYDLKSEDLASSSLSERATDTPTCPGAASFGGAGAGGAAAWTLLPRLRSRLTRLASSSTLANAVTLLLGGGGNDGSTSGGLASLTRQWLYITILTWIVSQIRDVFSYINPFNRILQYAWIDSFHRSHDDSYRWLMAYWTSHPRYSGSRSFILEASPTAYNDPENGAPLYGMQGRRSLKTLNGRTGSSLQRGSTASADEPVQPRFRPKENETFWLVHGRTLFRFSHTVTLQSGTSSSHYDDGRGVRVSTLTIRCFSMSRDPLISLLTTARNMYQEASPQMLSVLIYDPNSGGWRTASMRHRRKLGSIIMEEANRERLLADAKEFLESENWYARRGIPWKRGYMLWGAAGTGKSSTIIALASELDLPVYILPIGSNSMSDFTLSAALRSVPARSILVMEDVDVAMARTRQLKADKQNGEGSGSASAPPMPGPFLPGMPMALNRMMMRGRALTPTNANANLSLSGLLNCIDGVESAEGRILIMTTNDLDGLDPALIRAGRVDVFFEYKKATRDQARQLFVEFYRDGPSEREYAKASKAPPSAGLEEREDDVSNLEKEEVTRMAEGWSQWVDDGEFTIATLQGMLLDHKKTPHAAVEAMQKWVEKEREAAEVNPSQSGPLQAVDSAQAVSRNHDPSVTKKATENGRAGLSSQESSQGGVPEGPADVDEPSKTASSAAKDGEEWKSAKG